MNEVTSLLIKIDKNIVVTHIVIKWLKKQKIGNKYSLIVKKAENWLSKVIKEKNVD